MTIKEIITSSSSLHNPFEGHDPSEGWNELKAKSKPVDKAMILTTLAKQLEKITLQDISSKDYF